MAIAKARLGRSQILLLIDTGRLEPIVRSVTYAVMAVVLALCAAAAPAAAKTKEKPAKPFMKSEELLQWINGYKQAPQPNRLPLAVKAMAQLGITRDMDQAGIYIGFTAGVLGANPDTAEKLITAMFPLAPDDQVLLIKAIAYSGLQNWKIVLGEFIERMPARKVLIDKFLYGNKATLPDLPLEESSFAIDANWGYYFATGSEAPVKRILVSLGWSADKNDVEKLTIGAMAKWTLAQNAARDSDLLAMLKADVASEPPQVRQPLAEVIDAAETLELGKIKKQAMASIEELKAKGPERNRTYSWWGTAGQTVLALGCVAASAMGQVEIGVPCVVGGALSSAALKYMSPGP